MPHDGAAAVSDLEFGSVRLRIRQRRIQSRAATVTVEPLVMQLLVTLSQRAGQLVTRRELFDTCWGASPVGDDSLNRLVAVLRKALGQAGADSIRIETVAGAGYVLRLAREVDGTDSEGVRAEVDGAIEAASDSWRLGMPEPDHLRLEQLRRATALGPRNARAWGMLALLSRHAAEYGEANAASDHVRECEKAARRAIALEPMQPEAQTALVSLVPLFGGWGDARRRLAAILDANPDSPVPKQDLATLEMATGRVRVSKALRDELIARDPLAACYCYKSVYQHWSVGDLQGMDHVADRAIQLWPTHPAVWMVRLWTLAYTSRVPAALAMLEDDAARPVVPGPFLAFLRHALCAVEAGAPSEIEGAARACMNHARTGPANAIGSLFALGLLHRADEAFEIVDGYYLRAGKGPVPVQHTDTELSLNEQHRRLTQVLFTPVFANMRTDPRFMSICDRIGLSRYWEENGLTPDFLA